MRKFLQKLHSRSPGNGESPQCYLPPDVLVECEDLVLQVNDDPFETKLRANYEVGVAWVLRLVCLRKNLIESIIFCFIFFINVCINICPYVID